MHGLSNSESWGPQETVAMSARHEMAGKCRVPENIPVGHTVSEPAAGRGPVLLPREQARVTWGPRGAHRSWAGPTVCV